MPDPQGLALMPCAADVCQQCAVKHDADMPHNQQSLHWQYWFYGKNGRWPMWADALAHCDAEMKRLWTEELSKKGITIDA